MSIVHKFKHQQPSEDILITNIQNLMRNNGVSEAQLSRQTGIPQPTLHKILSGKTSDPRISTIKTIAEFFNVSVDSLYNENAKQLNTNQHQGVSAPIISWSDCLQAQKFIAKLSANNWDDWVLVDQEFQGSFCLTSKPSMAPYFPKGTILVVDSAETPRDGDLVIVHFKETTEATLRELSLDGPTKMLVPLNDNVEATPYDNNAKILGVVVQSRFSY